MSDDTIYVDPIAGDDNNPGTIDAPKKTYPSALEAAQPHPITTQEMGHLGGSETFRRHGPEFMRAIAKKGAAARWGDKIKPPVTEGRAATRYRNGGKKWELPEGAE